MKERIIEFLSAEKISPAEFADKIGVQRSSMSHILNGRNYPSASFLQKMLQSYPFVNPRWLMIGEGVMNAEPTGFHSKEYNIQMHNPSQTGIKPELDLVGTIPSQNISTQGDETEQQNIHDDLTVTAPESNSLPFAEPLIHKVVTKPDLMTEEKNIERRSDPLHSVLPTLHEDKEIDRVFFFYKDKTFTVYRPS